MERVNRLGKLYAMEQTLTLTQEEVAFSVTSPTQNGAVNLGAPATERGSADRGKRYKVCCNNQQIFIRSSDLSAEKQY